MSDFESALISVIQDLRHALADQDIGSMKLEIDAIGRTLAGDLRIEFSLSTEYGLRTSGGNLEAVVAEFIRRNTWSNCHEALCLSALDEA
jgi:hypothetical protein